MKERARENKGNERRNAKEREGKQQITKKIRKKRTSQKLNEDK